MCVPALDPVIKNADNVILAGIEAHVCVLQTALDLLEQGKNVHPVVDATSSRSLPDSQFIFKQITGVPQGGNLSPLLADIDHLDHLDSR
ncbi:hypothetical protein Aduo_011570 [Ancylostoma duodenale]